MNKQIMILSALLAPLWLASCVDDEGNNFQRPINEIEVSGIGDTYTKIGYTESLEIPVTLKGSLSGTDESMLEYQWFICNGGLDEASHQHTVISTEKDLRYPVNIPSGSYSVYFRVTDKSTGMQFEKESTLTVISPFVRGFYLFGDKEDGTCGMDFVSMIADRDTMVVADVLDNTTGMRGAKNLLFAGYYYSDDPVTLWALAENGQWSVDHDPSQGHFGIQEDVAFDAAIYPTVAVTRPMSLVDILPHPNGPSNTNRSGSWRMLITENEAFFCTSMISAPNSYGNPINRYNASTTTLFKPAPYVFYKDNAASASMIYTVLYDETNHCFAAQNTAYYGVTNMVKLNDSETPFWFDQTKYTPVRDLVYGENGYSGGYSYALMNDANGDYYVYKFLVNRYGASQTVKNMARTVDTSVATDFDKASHYAFYSEQPVVLYAVGSTLWAYDYMRNVSKNLGDLGGEITYLAMDAHSGGNTGDFIVATYNSTEKGTVYKYNIADDPNDIRVEPYHYQTSSYPWKTNLRVAKVEYRNSTK